MFPYYIKKKSLKSNFDYLSTRNLKKRYEKDFLAEVLQKLNKIIPLIAPTLPNLETLNKKINQKCFKIEKNQKKISNFS